jgi:hypothetical protein
MNQKLQPRGSVATTLAPDLCVAGEPNTKRTNGLFGKKRPESRKRDAGTE